MEVETAEEPPDSEPLDEEPAGKEATCDATEATMEPTSGRPEPPVD